MRKISQQKTSARWFTKAGRGWMRAGEKAAAVLGIAIFAVLYVIVFAPTAIIMKLSGKKFFTPEEANAESWFVSRSQLPATLEWMKRQW